MIKKVSIFILLYKNQDLIKPALKSVFSQLVPDGLEIELVVSDDASPCFDYKKLHDFFGEVACVNSKINWRVVRQEENVGTVKHLNSVLASLHGDVIIPLGADDAFYDENVISLIVEFFNKNQCLVATGRRIIYEHGFSKELHSAPNAKLDPLFTEEGQSKLLGHICKKGNVISGASTYYHRKLFDAVGLFDESFYLLEDFPFYIKLLNSDFRIHLIDKPVIKYQLGGISTSNSLNPLLKADFVRLYQKLLTHPNVGQKYRRYIRFNLYKFDACKLGFFERLGLLDLICINYLRPLIGGRVMTWLRLRKLF